MATVSKLDSNFLGGLRYAEEASLGTLPGSPVWYGLEPNSYNDFGGQLTLLERRPINESRQRKKGAITDLDANGGFNHDLVQDALQDIMQGFFFADLRPKIEVGGASEITTVDHAGNQYEGTVGLDFPVGALIFASDFPVAANNGLKRVTVDNATAGVNEVQQFDLGTASAGTFTITFDGQTTAAIAYDATAGTVDAALEALSNIGAGEVTCGGGALPATPVTLTFSGALGDQNLPQITIDSTGLTTPVVTISTTTPGASVITVAEDLVADTPAATSKLVEVGFQFDSGDLTMTVSGGFPVLGATTKDLTELGLIPGEWIYIGDDSAAAYAFATAACNGFARVRSITASAITLDKTQFTAVTDAGAAKTVRIFFGRVLKNETGTDIVRRTYQIERKLGVPDTSNPADYQSEYLVGAVANTCQFNIAQANKVNVDMSFLGTDFEQRTAADGLKTGTRPAISEEDAFNTSSDFSRIKLSLVSDSSSAPSPLFAYVTDITLSINNNVSPNKAVGVLGAFDMTAGVFEVGGNLTAYFATVEAVQAVRDNEDVTIDCHMVKANSGISIDMPLIALGNGRLDVVQDQAVTLPLDLQAATAAKVHADLDHTLLICFFSYLPDSAE